MNIKSVLLAAVLVSASVSVEAATVFRMEDTPPAAQLSMDDLLQNKAYWPPTCSEPHIKTCTFTGPGGIVYLWESMARLAVMNGKTIVFKGRCLSACYLAYREAVRYSKLHPEFKARVVVRENTVFGKHRPYGIRQ